LAALAWAELNWSLATLGPSGGGIGIGTSGYASVLYGRAIALGVMSAAFAAIGVLPVATLISLSVIEKRRELRRSLKSDYHGN
jgi:hypothetical protein